MEDKNEREKEALRQAPPKWEKPSVKEIDLTVATGLTYASLGEDGSIYS